MKKSHPPFFRVLWMTWVMGMLSVMTVSAADESVSPCVWKAEEGKQVAQWRKTQWPSTVCVKNH